ncbi:hypothetical protein BFP97_15160 [Roseivirga sp. 4D4]|uniref:hypothetical protein n=1 Tax=Roseivirga sp. 4D4 TaxID=1889784 RepID=UPI0008534DEB|nr:hypothetical protein [Roseivirga sp. 4D4]OEK02782.1 hypothetical protein BFP97_15160 [Roseivirga sp. 4D4]
MSSLRIRPRFKESVPENVESFKNRIQTALDAENEFSGLVSDQYCVIKIRPEERHYWSPQLTLTLEENSEDDLEVRGLYGPKPSVWAVFFMSYAALGILSLFAGVFGLSQLMLDKPAPILWAIPIMAAVALGLYLIAQAGQKVGAEQMFRIHHFYEQVIKHRVALT